MSEQPTGKLVGKVTHFFDKIGVAVVELKEGELSVGDTIRVEAHNGDFSQIIVSMQVNHQEVATAKVGESFGLKVDQPVKEGDKVYLVD